LVMSAVNVILRNLALTANYKMVDHYESTGEKAGWKQGFRWGWSRNIWKFFLMDLVVGIPLMVFVIAFFVCAMLPFALVATENNGAMVLGIVSGIALLILFVLLIIVISAFIGLWLKLAKRVCVFENKGVFESLSEGWRLMRKFWKDVLFMWLILIGVQIGVSIVTVPIVIILLIISGLFGAGVGFATWAISQGAIASLIIGFAIFVLVLSIPMTFVSGLSETYFETIWTLLYRETKSPLDLDAIPELPDLPQAELA